MNCRSCNCDHKPSWQPIEMAPKDGSKIVVRDEFGNVMFAKWDILCDAGWFNNLRKLENLVYWMPLPDPPKDDE